MLKTVFAIADNFKILAKQRVIYINLFLVCFFLSYVCNIVNAQNTIIQGYIKNNQSKPIENASVYLLNAKDSSLVKTAITDSTGAFAFTPITPKSYLIKASSIGYKDSIVSISDSTLNKSDALSIILTKEIGNRLDNVVVTGKKNIVEIKVDRIVFNPSGLISTAGDNAYEAIKKAPLVTANENGTISIRGIAGTGVMINGRLLQMSSERIMDYLKSIAADEVEKIEIITNPSSKYDAQGLAGLLNIVLKKNKKLGFNGTTNIFYQQNTYGKSGGNIDINYRSNKFNVFGGTTLRTGKYYSIEQVDNIYNRDVNPYLYYENGDRERNRFSAFNKIGIDYTINKNHIIGLRFEHNYVKLTGNELNNASFIKSNQSLDSIYHTHINLDNRSNSYTANINYQATLDTAGQTLTINADYFNYSQPIFSTLTNSERLDDQARKLGQDISFKNESNQSINIYSAKIDYTKSLSKSLNLELGAKVYSLITKNDINFYNIISNNLNIDSSKSNHFDYKESTIAGYTNLNKQFSDKWSTQAGFRMERTILHGTSKSSIDRVDQKYMRFFPSLFIQYNHNENNQFTVSYTQRISRPDFESLNPFKYYSTPNSYIEGNPFLQPSITNSFDLSYTLKQKYYFSLFFYSTRNEIAEFPILNTTNNSYKYITLNLDRGFVGGFSAYVPIQLKPWWKFSFSTSTDLNGMKAIIDSKMYKTARFYFEIQTNQQITFSKKKKIYGEINFQYHPSFFYGIYTTGRWLDLSIGFKKAFKDGRSTLSLNFTDIFNATYVTLKIDRVDQYSFTHGNPDRRGVKITFNYKLGKITVPKSRENKSGIEEEKTRIK